MGISQDDLELIEKIKVYRQDKEKLELLDFKNQALEKQNKQLKEALKDLQTDIIGNKKILNQINALKTENIQLKKEREIQKSQFELVVTTPKEARTVYGQIRQNLKKAKKEVLVCSPWITYLVEEFSGVEKEVKMKIITSFREEDIKSGITSLDKLRALMKSGAHIRYNNNLHAKMMFIDSEVAIISSANLTRKGLGVNYEAGVLIKDPDQVKKAIEFFQGVWDESEDLDYDQLKKYAILTE